MDFVVNIIKGAIIGIANIIPGVSGGTMALTLNVYDKLINAVGNFFKDFKKNFFFLLPFGIGAGLGIIIFSSIIKYSLEHYNMIVNFLFIGLILGSVPLIYKNATSEKFKISSIISFLIALSLMVILSFLSVNDTSIIKNLNLFNFIKLFICSLIAASAMILPGISGSLVLMILGCYTSVLTAITDLNIVILIPVFLGVICGVIIGAKIIDLCLKKFKQATYFAILGLILGSLIPIIKNITFSFSFNLLFAIIALLIGTFIALFFSKEK